MFHYTVSTNKSVEVAIADLEKQLQEEKFGVLWAFDIKSKLQEKGLEFSKAFHVLEVCNPHEAKKVLDETMMAGYFLPCKIIVFEDKDDTKIGMVKPSELMGLLEDENLKNIALDIEKRLTFCIDKAV
ncbi:DUF302 domain-containing protein [Bacillus sp. HMF5848]|uniref:DUF302 domain-containing protein n=1 Tax=Bacillus sp. HMF5848 TaxID=2495421 RepID=UPI000F76A7DE|nr:DUF302 domain-containing protein [Bacillus sp. HMF5848]RSK26530.1 DUF302 domain-containing protein [Bacillus sp. HMF5848]